MATLSEPKEKAVLMRAATYASVGLASVLICVKLYAWHLTDSVSLLSTLIDSVLDAGASLVNLVAVHYALQPADSEHRFGHGKAEPLAGLLQAGFIAASALFLIIETVKRVIEPSPVANSEFGILVMGISIVATVFLVGFQRYVIAKTQSVAVSADSLHYLTDILVNSAVICALVITYYTDWLWVDPLFAGLIALYILWSVREIATQAINLLMDREFSEEERSSIVELVRGHPEVINMHDLRTRSSGPQQFIQLHLVLNANLRLKDSHRISDEIEMQLLRMYPNAEILIHQDPHNVVENALDFDELAPTLH